MPPYLRSLFKKKKKGQVCAVYRGMRLCVFICEKVGHLRVTGLQCNENSSGHRCELRRGLPLRTPAREYPRRETGAENTKRITMVAEISTKACATLPTHLDTGK